MTINLSTTDLEVLLEVLFFYQKNVKDWSFLNSDKEFDEDVKRIKNRFENILNENVSNPMNY